MPDVITLITSDHREMEKLFNRLKKERSSRPELLRYVSAMLTAHARAEEAGVYPEIARAIGEDDQIDLSEEEHHEAESLLEVLERTDPDSPDFDDRLHEFIDAVEHHIEEEEMEILPALRESVSLQRLDELGKVFDDRRREELSALGMDGDGQHPSEGSRHAASSPSSPSSPSGTSSTSSGAGGAGGASGKSSTGGKSAGSAASAGRSPRSATSSGSGKNAKGSKSQGRSR